MNDLFLNGYEKVTYEKLSAVCEPIGAKVFSKVRLSDVIPVQGSGLNDDDFSFALKAHVDFLVTDSKFKREFCVEFDGPRHQEPKQKRRDEIKDRLLTRFGMPFIRINSKYLVNKYRNWDLLTYFTDVWFLAAAFYEAQESGGIPWDEGFDPTFVLTSTKEHRRSWPYWLSHDLVNRIYALYERAEIAQASPNYWIGRDERNNIRCLMWLVVTDKEGIFIETGIREHKFDAVDCGDLISQIGVFDLYEAFLQTKKDKVLLKPCSEIDLKIKHYEERFKCCGFSLGGVRDGAECPGPSEKSVQPWYFGDKRTFRKS